MKKLIDYISSYESHDWAKCEETCNAIKEAKQILLDAEGSKEDRKELLEAIMSHQWVQGGNDHQEGI